jgi:hypothetical protein
VPWEYREDISDVIIELKSQGVFIVSSEISKNSVSYEDVQFKLPVGIVL